jgi:hypothetical protein
VNVDQVAHAGGEVDGRAAANHSDLAPWPTRVQEDEKINGSVALMFVIVTLALTWLARDGPAPEREGFIRRQPRWLAVSKCSLAGTPPGPTLSQPVKISVTCY